MFSMGPNYEMALFIAQTTGSVILTDSETRRNELQAAQHRSLGVVNHPWNDVYRPLSVIPLDYEAIDLFKKSSKGDFVELIDFLKSADNLVDSSESDNDKIALMSRKEIKLVERVENKPDLDTAEFTVLSPEGGFYDTTVQRLMLKSNCQQYLDKVSSVYFIETY